MDFILTDHAKRRCTKRKILVLWIQSALDNPARIEADHEDEALLHAL